MKKFASNFQLMMAVQQGEPRYVRLNDKGEYGLYLPKFTNSFGTPLAAKGWLGELQLLVKELA